MQKFDISTLDKLEEQIVKLVGDFSERQIVLLVGPLGSGKTQSVRFIVKHLQGEDICSPSFSIHNTYETKRGDVEHIDLYRLEDEGDIESTGFWDLFEKEKARFQQSPKAAREVLKVGKYPLDKTVNRTTTAALSVVANTILNHDEAYMRR